MVVLCSVEVVLVAQDVLEFEYFRSEQSVRRFSTTKVAGYFLQLGGVGDNNKTATTDTGTDSSRWTKKAAVPTFLD